jgi:DNA ligase-associated metallophosphoesterase
MKITFANHEAELGAEGVLWIPALKLLCVADLHFEKGSFFSRFSTFLPPYDSLETIKQLEKAVSQYQPEILIAAGDSFHDKNAADRLSAELREQLDVLISRVQQWFWITGNHDPSIATHIKGTRAEELKIGGINFRHKTEGGAFAEVSGHYHPKLRKNIRGQMISARCFVREGNRLILPSFGKYTGGLDVNSPAFLEVVGAANRELFVAHEDRVFSF